MGTLPLSASTLLVVLSAASKLLSAVSDLLVRRERRGGLKKLSTNLGTMLKRKNMTLMKV